MSQPTNPSPPSKPEPIPYASPAPAGTSTLPYVPHDTLDHPDAPKGTPWLFLPMAYFMQALPVFLVQALFPQAWKNMGVANADIALWGSLIGLPWTFKLFWGPLVELNFRKREWILWMQGFLLAGFVAVSLAVNVPVYFFQVTLAILFIIAIFSATHDIALDGFYLMLGYSKKKQAFFAGVNTTAFRLGRLFCLFAIVYISGYTQRVYGLTPAHGWTLALAILAISYGCLMAWGYVMLPRPARDTPAPVQIPGENSRNIIRVLTIVLIGIGAYLTIQSAIEFTGKGIYSSMRAAGYLQPVVPPAAPLAAATLPATAPATFPASLPATTAATLPATAPAAAVAPPVMPLGKWDMTKDDMILHLTLGIIGLFIVVPLLATIKRTVGTSEVGLAFGSYVKQPGFAAILFFILFYRFGEVMVGVIAPLFILDPVAKGGMGLNLEENAVVNGIISPVGLIVGGLLGGIVVAKFGLRRAFIPMAVLMHVPNAAFIWLAWQHPDWHWLYVAMFLDTFGYGFGFSAYFIYLMYVAQRGKYPTAHYAIGTGLGALCITLAGITSSIVLASFSYLTAFIVVCFLTIPGMISLLLIPMDNDATKKLKAEEAAH